MSDDTKIEWTDATWNPVRGCTRVSTGCTRCYAERDAARWSGPGQPYEGYVEQLRSGPRWTGLVELVPSMLDRPLHWKKPRRIFVNSMSDLFHERLPPQAIADVWEVMARSPQHTFQILTKRPHRMRAWVREHLPIFGVLPNVWLGVSVEDQSSADTRVPLLLDTPAVLRWLSLEPLLERVKLPRAWLGESTPEDGKIGWLVVGGESGEEARDFDPDWARSLLSLARGAGVPFFLKQLGSRVWLCDPGEPVGAFYEPQDKRGANPELFPEDLRVREWPIMVATPKQGRML